jgi:hypothetical protein
LEVSEKWSWLADRPGMKSISTVSMGVVGVFAFQLYNHMSPTIFLAAITILLALMFDFTKGFNDSTNQVATVISSRALDAHECSHS